MLSHIFILPRKNPFGEKIRLIIGIWIGISNVKVLAIESQVRRGKYMQKDWEISANKWE
jgi:hypothetical protein